MPMEIIITTDPQHQHGHQRELLLLNVRQVVLQLRHDLLLAHQPVSQDHLLHRQIDQHPPQPVNQDHLLHRQVALHRHPDQWVHRHPDQRVLLLPGEAEEEAEGASLPGFRTRHVKNRKETAPFETVSSSWIFFYSNGISDASISLTQTYWPSLFSNRHI